jgi:hypothetical protein
MPTSNLAVVPLLAAALVASCAGSGPSGAPVPSSSTTSTTSAAAQTFDGRGYVYALPAGWYGLPAVGDWELGTSPARRVMGFDTFQAPHGELWIVVGRRPVTPGSQVADWVRHMTDTKTITYPASTCDAPEHEATATLGHAPALVRSFHCPVDGPLAVAVHVLAIHENFGFVAMCFDKEQANGPIPEFEGVCLRLLTGFSFSN